MIGPRRLWELAMHRNHRASSITRAIIGAAIVIAFGVKGQKIATIDTVRVVWKD